METRTTHLNAHYRPPVSGDWVGRNDGDGREHIRWHQVMQLLDLRKGIQSLKNTEKRPIALLGFACDAGVTRNKGRAGAVAGPEAIRKALCNLPVHDSGPGFAGQTGFTKQSGSVGLWDAGDITCPDGQLETAQEQLGLAVSMLLNGGFLPIVLGGGHEVTYGHFIGIRSYLSKTDGYAKNNALAPNKLGLINFDAHFDNREPGENGPSSGTGFYQIEQEQDTVGQGFNYLCIGIQRSSNTQILFERADRSGTAYLFADRLHSPENLEKTQQFIEETDHLYLSIDMDVFAQAYAPGVSAPTALGIQPDPVFFSYLNRVVKSDKLLSVDIAELNPALDRDGQTARLAAALIFYITEKITIK